MENQQNNIGINNNLINNQVQGNGNTIYNNTAANNTAAQPVTERIKQEPVMFFGKQVQTKWIFIAGIIATITDLFNIYTSYRSLVDHKPLGDVGSASFIASTYFPIIVLFITVAVWAIYSILRDSVLVIGKYKIASHQGKLYFEDYAATCPQCGGKLKVTNINNTSYLRCDLYPAEHRYRFNPKIFDQEYYS